MRLHQLTHKGVKQRLFVSGHTRGMLATAAQQRLLEHGITRVVCVAPTMDEELQKLIPEQYLHVPLPDGKYLDAAVVRRLVRTIANWLYDHDESVLVHCRAGRNRSCLIAALVLVYFQQDPAGVLEELRLIRPNALANPLFEQIVTEDWREYI